MVNKSNNVDCMIELHQTSNWPENDKTSTNTAKHTSKEEETVWMQVQLSTVIRMISQPGYL